MLGFSCNKLDVSGSFVMGSPFAPVFSSALNTPSSEVELVGLKTAQAYNGQQAEVDLRWSQSIWLTCSKTIKVVIYPLEMVDLTI